MNDEPSRLPRVPRPDAGALLLREAVRRARAEGAERAQAGDDLRAAALSRLEALHEALRPVLDALPPEAEMFDHGVVPGPTPRLFVDMVAHVELSRDRRAFRLLQETRAGRRPLAEGGEAAMVAAVTDYLARRLVERERLLAEGPGPAPRAPPAPRRAPLALLAFALGLAGGAGAAAVWWRLGPPLWAGLKAWAGAS